MALGAGRARENDGFPRRYAKDADIQKAAYAEAEYKGDRTELQHLRIYFTHIDYICTRYLIVRLRALLPVDKSGNILKIRSYKFKEVP